MTVTSHPILDKFPEPNPDPQVPDNLLENPASLPMCQGDDEFDQLVESRHGKVPKYAGCHTDFQTCNIMFYNGKQRGYSGDLSYNLPQAEWPNHKKPERTVAWGILAVAIALLLGGIILCVSQLPLEQNIGKVSIFALGFFLIVFGSIMGWKQGLPIGIDTPSILDCNRPPLGPKTKKRIASHLKTGWEEVHLLWPAENNWHRPEEKQSHQDQWQETCLLVLGKRDYDFFVADKIEDRTI